MGRCHDRSSRQVQMTILLGTVHGEGLEAGLLSLTSFFFVRLLFENPHDGGNVLQLSECVITETQSRNLLDGNDTAATALELVNGVAFIELDALTTIDVVGFVSAASVNQLDAYPRTIRVYTAASSSGPWSLKGTQVLTSSPAISARFNYTRSPRDSRLHATSDLSLQM
eukprot:scaffold6704_cov137-Isochrysis_galbana.AAC.4